MRDEQKKRLVNCSYSGIITCGGIWYTVSNTQGSSDKPVVQKPIDPQAKTQEYINQPEPIYKGNKDMQEQLLAKKEEITTKIRLVDNKNFSSTKLTTWGEYLQAEGGNVKHSEIDDTDSFGKLQSIALTVFTQRAELF